LHVSLTLPLSIDALTYYESFAKKFTALRDYGLKEAIEQIRMEDENTYYMGIGPVNKAMNWLVWYHHSGKDSLEFKLHVERNAHFLWLGAEGMMMNGTDGTQLWDTAFIAQACAEAGLAKNTIYRENMVKVLEFLDMTQVNRILDAVFLYLISSIFADQREPQGYGTM
jgi:lanosterol synthase